MRILDALASSYRDSIASVPYGDGELISLPTTFTSGAMLSVLVTISDGVVEVTDRGITADDLSDAGLDFDSPTVLRSFDAVRDSTGLAPAFGADVWEITATTDVADVAIAIQAVADAAMRADGLRALSRSTKSVSFADRSIDRLSARTAVVPRAPMLGRYGEKRQVTLSYAGRDDHFYYVQALAGRDGEARSRSYDHASGLFIAASPEKTHRVALLQKGSWEAWRVQNLLEVCRVVDEDEVDSFVDSTKATA